MQIDIIKEMTFQTARSGGKGGQNVNKVETKVIGIWHVASSLICNDRQKGIITNKLHTKITDEGCIIISSQIARTQLANKGEVIRKMNDLISKALTPKIPRIATKPSKASKEKRLKSKAIASERKQNRKKDW